MNKDIFDNLNDINKQHFNKSTERDQITKARTIVIFKLVSFLSFHVSRSIYSSWITGFIVQYKMSEKSNLSILIWTGKKILNLRK